jgi:hypothetical protein
MVERDERARTSPHWFASQLDSSENKIHISKNSPIGGQFFKKGKV